MSAVGSIKNARHRHNSFEARLILSEPNAEIIEKPRLERRESEAGKRIAAKSLRQSGVVRRDSIVHLSIAAKVATGLELGDLCANDP
jgi:hypothetical protein